MKSKYSFLSIVFLITSLFACKEIPPFIDFSGGPTLLKDTTYITGSIPAKPKKNALIEDISGVRCVNCPAASETAKDIIKTHGPRVSLITLHPTSMKQYTAPHTGYDTLSTEVAELVMTKILGKPTGLPAGAVNRTKFAGENSITMGHTKWEKYVVDELALFTPIVLETTFVGNESERKGVLSVKVVFAEAIAKPVALSVFLLESNIVSKQSTQSGYDEKYKHIAVLREGITSYNGLKLGNTFEAGRTFEKDLEIEFADKYVYQNCSFVVIIYYADGESYEVLQVNNLGT